MKKIVAILCLIPGLLLMISCGGPRRASVSAPSSARADTSALRPVRPCPPDVSPTNLIIMYDQEIGKEALLEAVREYNASIIYDYNIIPGIAIRIPDGSDIQDAIVFFRNVKGVVAVERDHIYQVPEPVRPRLEVM